MKTYTVIFAEDVPHYGTVEIRAANDADAIEAAKAYDRDELFLEPEWQNAVCRRIVKICDDETGKTVALDIAVDNYFLRNGERDRILCDTAPELLAVLEEAKSRSWVCNAALTTDIEALRRICLEYADWWNGRAWPAIEKAKAGAL